MSEDLEKKALKLMLEMEEKEGQEKKKKESSVELKMPTKKDLDEASVEEKEGLMEKILMIVEGKERINGRKKRKTKNLMVIFSPIYVILAMMLIPVEIDWKYEMFIRIVAISCFCWLVFRAYVDFKEDKKNGIDHSIKIGKGRGESKNGSRKLSRDEILKKMENQKNRNKNKK